MISPAVEVQQKVVKFVQELLLGEYDRSSITPAIIDEKIDMVLMMQPKWGENLDRESVSDEIIRRFSMWIGTDTTLVSTVGHVSWLTPQRKRDWRYWQRYREWMERRLSPIAVDALDQSSDTVLGFLEDPEREGPWDRRGLVVGHVQSGKTGNYTGLICKAADAGYKIIIVLAGLHNNLRSQTQLRLDEGFLGFETNPARTDMRIIGVGEIDADARIRPNFATNRLENGDFNRAAARNLGVSPEQRPWLFVVKKNKSVLNLLHTWIHDHVADTTEQETGIRVVTHLPLLVIDDEADHASVDTGELVLDDEGRPDLEHQPTAINSSIRKILRSFSRSAYVGYTATPFANIFIHERGETKMEGPDLFPSAFIVNLAAPSNYIGPAAVFGLRTAETRSRLPLVHEVLDAGTWMPQVHKSWHSPPSELPASLIMAVDAFLLSCAVRRLRGQGIQHASMLVHVTRFVAVQNLVREQIEHHVHHIRQRLERRVDHETIFERFRNLWEKDFVPTNEALRERSEVDGTDPLPSWEDLTGILAEVVAEIKVRAINGTAKDALDYVDTAATGLKVIAIGGDKLARGLTLEGLTVSYFLRASRMYDTLMQMGRWFGYRPGYLDVCRLYTTSDLVEWFQHITDAAELLREEFDYMSASGSTPREYGLKVQSHSTLMVTSPLKMRAARNLMLSFSGDVVETISLHRDSTKLRKNLRALENLISKGGTPEADPKRERVDGKQEWKGYLWTGVPAEYVLEFLSSYETHPDATKVNGAMLAEFVTSMIDRGELTEWVVALIGGGEGAEYSIPGGKISMLKRAAVKPVPPGKYSIGRLLSPRDETIDLNADEWLAALDMTRRGWHADPGRFSRREPPDQPSGLAARKVRGFGAPGVDAHPERGLLLLYLLDPRKAEADLQDDTPVVAFGISFPGSNTGVTVEYKVNNVEWENLYGSAE
jgi:hypothetical protein